MPTLLSDLADTISRLSLHAIGPAAVYPYRKALAEAAWTPDGRPRSGLPRWSAFARSLLAPGLRWPDTWITPGATRSIRFHDRGALFETERGWLDVTFFAPDLVRVRYRPFDHADAREPAPYAIAKPLDAWPVPDIVPIQAEGAHVFASERLMVGVALASSHVFLAGPTGPLLRADMDVAWNREGAVRQRVALASGERIFGLGERATPWDRRGRTHTLWNTDPAGYENGDDPINLNIPVYLGVVPGTPPATYMLFYENPTYAEFDLGDTHPDVGEHRFAGGELRYYFAAGPVHTLLERYTELTGRHPRQPLWMLGYQQSRWSYSSEARVRKLAQDFHDHQVPCDAIHLDIDYMEGFRCFMHNRERFPDMAGMAADLREQGIKLISIIDPGIKQDPGYDVYREGVREGHFCTLPDGRVFHAPVWPGNSAFPDFTDPAARAWWGKLYRPLIESGIAGFWNDMNEPSAFAAKDIHRTLPSTVQHALEGTGGSHDDIHNVYGMLMVRATREGLQALQPDKRPVVITRAGWAGVQRYATSWTADNHSTWDALRLTIPLVMGLGLSGLGFTGSDIGGFSGTPSGELYTRWIQMGAFMPFFRAHTALGTPDQEPWTYGEPYLSIVRRFIELRYELLPYLYTALWQMCTRGWPVVRPLAWTDPDGAALWDIDDAFLCGDALLVAPVVAEGATRRDVTLPAGTWYDFWSNRAHHGGQAVTTLAPLEILPLFVREGTLLTLGEIGPSVEQRKDRFLRLWLYALRQPGETVTELYEDAGEGHDYLAGDYRLSRLTMKRTADLLTVTWESEGTYTPPYEHIELTLNGLDRAPQAVRADDEPYPILQIDPVRRTALAAVPPFKRLEIVL